MAKLFARAVVLCWLIPLAACDVAVRQGDQARADNGCAAGDFDNQAAGEEVVTLLRDCGVRTATEARELVAGYPTKAKFLRSANASAPLQVIGQPGKYDVLVCNLSPNRGIFEQAASTPTRRVITGRSCWEFEDVDQVALLGGRTSDDPLGDGDGPANQEWFGIYFVRPAAS
jgi:hypothetical protein